MVAKLIPRLQKEEGIGISEKPPHKAPHRVIAAKGSTREDLPERSTKSRDREYVTLQEAIRQGNQYLRELEEHRVLLSKKSMLLDAEVK